MAQQVHKPAGQVQTDQLGRPQPLWATAGTNHPPEPEPPNLLFGSRTDAADQSASCKAMGSRKSDSIGLQAFQIRQELVLLPECRRLNIRRDWSGQGPLLQLEAGMQTRILGRNRFLTQPICNCRSIDGAVTKTRSYCMMQRVGNGWLVADRRSRPSSNFRVLVRQLLKILVSQREGRRCAGPTTAGQAETAAVS